LASEVNLQATKKGVVRAVFPLATERNSKTKGLDSSNFTDFHRVVFFGPLSDFSKECLQKGSSVFVEGKLVNNSYKLKDGSVRFRTEVWGEEINVLTFNKPINTKMDF